MRHFILQKGDPSWCAHRPRPHLLHPPLLSRHFGRLGLHRTYSESGRRVPTPRSVRSSSPSYTHKAKPLINPQPSRLIHLTLFILACISVHKWRMFCRAARIATSQPANCPLTILGNMEPNTGYIITYADGQQVFVPPQVPGSNGQVQPQSMDATPMGQAPIDPPPPMPPMPPMPMPMPMQYAICAVINPRRALDHQRTRVAGIRPALRHSTERGLGGLECEFRVSKPACWCRGARAATPTTAVCDAESAGGTAAADDAEHVGGSAGRRRAGRAEPAAAVCGAEPVGRTAADRPENVGGSTRRDGATTCVGGWQVNGAGRGELNCLLISGRCPKFGKIITLSLRRSQI